MFHWAKARRLRPIGYGAFLVALLLSGCVAPPPRSEPVDMEPHILPRTESFAYTIREGDTLYSISQRFSVDWRDVFILNPYLDPRGLVPGTTLLIPGERRDPASAPVVATPAPSEPVEIVPLPDPTLPRNVGHAGPIPAERQLIWPIEGRIIARYGAPVRWRKGERNVGLDIAARAGQRVVAARSGRVNVFEDVPGYGRSVVLEHTDGSVTFYGHLREALVAHGRWVRQGETIASAGSSGHSKGTELHFRVMQGEKFVNPLPLLP